MNKAIVTILLLISQACAYSADQPANSESRQGSSTSVGSERKTDKSESNTSKKSITVNSEIGVGTLFLETLLSYERENPYQELDGTWSKRCTAFNATSVIYTVPGGGHMTRRDGPAGPSYEFRDGGAYATAVGNEIFSRAGLGGQAELKTLGRQETPRFRLMCLSLYADLVEYATRILLAKKIDVEAINPYGDKVFLIPDLRAKVSQAFMLADQHRRSSVDLFNYMGDCVVPTSQGLQSGQGDVKCAEWSFSARGGQLALAKGGAKWLDQDSVHGRKILFAEANAAEVQSQLQSTSSKFAKKESTTQRSQSRTATVIPQPKSGEKP